MIAKVKDLQWNGKSHLMEHDVSEFPRIDIIVSGATDAMQRQPWRYKSIISLSHRNTMVQTGTKVKMFQHWLVGL